MNPASVPFRKMNGLGNEFAVVDARTAPFRPSADIVMALADRRRGIGFDQLIILEPARSGTGVFMRIHNADGSEVESCGNAARCVADLLMVETGADEVAIDTLGGRLLARRAGRREIAVLFAPPRVGWRDIPLARPLEDTREVAGVAAAEAAGLAPGTAVNVGNPHIVYWVADPDVIDLARLGGAIELDPMFPARVNVSFATVVAPDHLRARVWERGAGATKACGTAACAVAVAAVRTGRTGRAVTVTLPGGDLAIHWRPDDTIEMTGPVAYEFEGRLDPETGTWSAYV